MLYDTCARERLVSSGGAQATILDSEKEPSTKDDRRTVRSVLWWFLLFTWICAAIVMDLGIGIGGLGVGIVALAAQLVSRYSSR